MRTFGFTVILGKSYNCNNISADSIITYDDIRCFKHMIDKFEKDKVFSNDNNYIVIVDGVILNKNVLITRMGGNTWLDTIIKLYIEKGELFLMNLEGLFADYCMISLVIKPLFSLIISVLNIYIILNWKM